MVVASLYETGALFMAQHMAGEAVTGEPCPPMPARGGAWGIYEVFPTSDGEPLFVGITSDPHFRAFCAEFGWTDWLADARFTTNGDRVANRPALRELVAAVIASHSISDLSEALDRIGVPFSPVRRPSDLFDDPQLNAGGRMLETRMVGGNMIKLPALPFTIDGEAPRLRRQPPLSGEQTDEIMTQFGYTSAEIARRRDARIIV